MRCSHRGLSNVEGKTMGGGEEDEGSVFFTRECAEFNDRESTIIAVSGDPGLFHPIVIGSG